MLLSGVCIAIYFALVHFFLFVSFSSVCYWANFAQSSFEVAADFCMPLKCLFHFLFLCRLESPWFVIVFTSSKPWFVILFFFAWFCIFDVKFVGNFVLLCFENHVIHWIAGVVAVSFIRQSLVFSFCFCFLLLANLIKVGSGLIITSNWTTVVLCWEFDLGMFLPHARVNHLIWW